MSECFLLYAKLGLGEKNFLREKNYTPFFSGLI